MTQLLCPSQGAGDPVQGEGFNDFGALHPAIPSFLRQWPSHFTLRLGPTQALGCVSAFLLLRISGLVLQVQLGHFALLLENGLCLISETKFRFIHFVPFYNKIHNFLLDVFDAEYCPGMCSLFFFLEQTFSHHLCLTHCFPALPSSQVRVCIPSSAPGPSCLHSFIHSFSIYHVDTVSHSMLPGTWFSEETWSMSPEGSGFSST